MRRMLSILLTAALAAGLCCVTAFAHHGGGQNCWEYSVSVCTGCGGGHSYVDADGDGVCDHYAGSTCTGCGGGHSYADADGDGVCDHYAARQPRGGRHCGRWR